MLNQIDKRTSDESLRSQNAISNKTPRITILDNIRKQNMLDTRQYLASDDIAKCDVRQNFPGRLDSRSPAVCCGHLVENSQLDAKQGSCSLEISSNRAMKIDKSLACIHLPNYECHTICEDLVHPLHWYPALHKPVYCISNMLRSLLQSPVKPEGLMWVALLGGTAG